MTPRTRSRAARLLAATVLAGLATAAAAAPAPQRADRPIRVTGTSPFPESCSGSLTHYESETEPSLAVSPRNPDVLVASWMQDATVAHPVARSTDGGRSWRTVVVPGLTPCTDGGRTDRIFDPWLSYGGDGLLYLSSAAGGGPHPLTGATGHYSLLSRHVWVHVSADDGRTWREPVAAASDDHTGFFLDKPTITADPTRPGHAYVTWTRFVLAGLGTIGFARTTDGGRTWQQPTLPYVYPGTHGVVWASQIVVDPRTGDLLVVMADGPPQPGLLANKWIGSTRMFTARSTDAGLTWETPVQIGEASQPLEMPTIAMGSEGTAYVTWPNDLGDGGSAVLIVSSRDGGRTWTPPATVATRRNVVRVTMVAVDGRGAVGVTWYEDRPALVSAVSRDRGRSWAVRDLAAGYDIVSAPATNSAGGMALGDYTGLVGLRSGFLSVASLPDPYAKDGPTDLFATRFGH